MSRASTWPVALMPAPTASAASAGRGCSKSHTPYANPQVGHFSLAQPTAFAYHAVVLNRTLPTLPCPITGVGGVSMIGPVFYLELLTGSRRGRLKAWLRLYCAWLVLQFIFFYASYLT